MSEVIEGFANFADERGTLLAVEFAQVDFPVRRIFVVTGPPGGSERGHHAVPCRQEVALVSGEARFVTRSGSTGEVTETLLDRVGQRLALAKGDYISYRLRDAESQIVVLANEPYAHGDNE